MIKSTVPAKILMEFVWKANPGMTKSELARIIDRDESRIAKIEQQETVGLSLADHILTKLDLNYLLATGDIPITDVDTSPPKPSYEQLQAEVSALKRRVYKLTTSRDLWKDRAINAEARLKEAS